MTHILGIIWMQCGKAAYWVVRPALCIYLPRTKRTRVVFQVADEILVTRTWLSDGRWSLPGGGLHRSEAAVDGATRELYEETGISVTVSEMHYLKTEAYRDQSLSYTAIYYSVVRSDKPPIRTQRFEICDYAWLKRADIHASICAPDVLSGIGLIKQ